jgi:hypothetical protein
MAVRLPPATGSCSSAGRDPLASRGVAYEVDRVEALLDARPARRTSLYSERTSGWDASRCSGYINPEAQDLPVSWLGTNSYCGTRRSPVEVVKRRCPDSRGRLLAALAGPPGMIIAA